MASPHIVADNDDLLREILIRLPVESLLRFKLVSKHWLSLITDQLFCLNKSQIHCKHISGLFLEGPAFYLGEFYNFIRFDDDNNNPLLSISRTLPLLPDQSKLKILRSCNGLFLCCADYLFTGGKTLQRRVFENNYYIVNPTTDKVTTINPHDHLYHPISSDSGWLLSTPDKVYLAFDPRKSDNYKVIQIHVTGTIRHGEADSYDFEIGIYNSASRVWKLCSYKDVFDSHPFGPMAQVNLGAGVYWNGAINWASNWGNSLYFNVDEERLGTFQVPPGIFEMPRFPIIGEREENSRIMYFGESNDHLHLIAATCPLATGFKVYEMMDKEYSGWFVKYQFDMETVMNNTAAIKTVNPRLPSNLHHRDFDIIDVVRRKDDRESFLVLSVHGLAICYNFTDTSVKKVHDFYSNRPLRGSFVIRYHNSFRFIYSLM